MIVSPPQRDPPKAAAVAGRSSSGAGVTNRDSFIDEVTEEVRRDRLFRLFRRYGWIAVLAVVLIVAGAAVNEWRKAQARQAAQAEGDAVLAALDRDTPAARAQALEGIDASGDVAAVLALLAAAETADGAGRAAALDRLDRVAGQDGLDPALRDLAALKAVILRGDALAPDERIARLEPLTAPGAPYRPLALEQVALARIEAGDTDAAIGILTDLLSDNDAPQGLRGRAQQLIVALGGSLEAS